MYIAYRYRSAGLNGLKMNRLRLYLILAILIVGIIPDPRDLFGLQPIESCNHYDSLFVSIYPFLEDEYCSAVPSDWTFIDIPGNLVKQPPIWIGRNEIFPHLQLVIRPAGEFPLSIWGDIQQPGFWRDESWLLKGLNFNILPRLRFEWGYPT